MHILYRETHQRYIWKTGKIGLQHKQKIGLQHNQKLYRSTPKFTTFSKYRSGKNISMIIAKPHAHLYAIENIEEISMIYFIELRQITLLS